jgi:PAS domain S-box-containing protein
VEETLRESEHRFRSTLDNMMEGCQIIGNDWQYLYINHEAELHNHRPKEELMGKRYMDMWPGIEETEVFVMIRRCLEERIAHHMENQFVFPDGATGWFDLSIQPVPEGVFILSMDITERKRAEEKILRQLEELHRWQDVTLGREDRNRQLKREVNELAIRLGEAIRYPSHESDGAKDLPKEVL